LAIPLAADQEVVPNPGQLATFQVDLLTALLAPYPVAVPFRNAVQTDDVDRLTASLAI
jgi:hypothetical protein